MTPPVTANQWLTLTCTPWRGHHGLANIVTSHHTPRFTSSGGGWWPAETLTAGLWHDWHSSEDMHRLTDNTVLSVHCSHCNNNITMIFTPVTTTRGGSHT